MSFCVTRGSSSLFVLRWQDVRWLSADTLFMDGSRRLRTRFFRLAATFAARAVNRFEKAGNQDARAQSKEESLDLFPAHALVLLLPYRSEASYQTLRSGWIADGK